MKHTDHGKDDDKDPAELDRGTNNLDFSKNGHTENIDEDDDDPENSNPRRRGHFVGPETKYRSNGLEFVGDGDDVQKPIGPAQSKGGRGTHEFASLRFSSELVSLVAFAHGVLIHVYPI